MDAMIAEGLQRILSDARLEEIDRSAGLGAEAEALWATLSDNGYARLCVAEQFEGFGGALADAMQLGALTARHAAAIPLADSALAMGLLSASGIAAPNARIGLQDPCDSAAPVGHASQIDAVLTLIDGKLVCYRVTGQDFDPIDRAEDGAARLIGEPAATEVSIAAPNWLTTPTFHALGALLRASQMSGAMQAVLDLTLNYTQEREQFGRPLAKFQAIQHHLSDIACETAAAAAAVEMASDALRADPTCGPEVIDEIAIAKIRCGEAASRVASCAHQAHGAMGFTREYALGRFTRRLWQWQDDFGASTQWAEFLGSAVLAEAEPALWPRISRQF